MQQRFVGSVSVQLRININELIGIDTNRANDIGVLFCFHVPQTQAKTRKDQFF